MGCLSVQHSVLRLSMYLGYVFYLMHSFKYFLPFLRLSFHFLDGNEAQIYFNGSTVYQCSTLWFISLVFYLKKKKSLPKTMLQRFSPMFSSGSFVCLVLTLGGSPILSYFFCTGNVRERFKVHLFAYKHQIVSAIFAEKTIFSSLNYLGNFFENQLTIFMWVYFWSVFSVLP